MSSPIRPPFTLETALAKVQTAEDTWNSLDPHRDSLAYTENSEWRNRAEFITVREAIRALLTRKWAKEINFLLKTDLAEPAAPRRPP